MPHWTRLSIIETIELCGFVLGASLNVLLLHLIVTCSKKQLGSYKHLLRIFVSYDIFMVALLAAMQPITYSTGSTLGVYSRAFPNHVQIPMLCNACLSGAFTLMNIYFLHRYWTVGRTHRVALFSRPSFQLSISCYPITIVALWYRLSMFISNDSVGQDIIRRSVTDAQSVSVTNGWVTLYIWDCGRTHVVGLIVLLCGGSIVLVNLLIGATLFTLTTHRLNTEITLSSYYKAYQFKILRALVAQSAIPLIFVYVPVGIGISLTLFITDERPGDFDYWFAIVSTFPALDAIVIIALMRDYRDGLVHIVFPRWNCVDVIALSSSECAPHSASSRTCQLKKESA